MDDIVSNQTTHRPDTQKAIRLVEYHQRLATLRAKPVRQLNDYAKVVWVSSVPHEPGCFTRAWGRDQEHGDDEWLEVQKRDQPPLPTLPPECKAWVSKDALWNKKDLPQLFSEITIQLPNPDWSKGSDQPRTLAQSKRIEEHPEVQAARDRYVQDKWLPWTDDHDCWESVHRVYSELFAIHQEQLRLGEEYQLVLGLGLLTWLTPGGQRTRRHLVVADAILEFEARLGRFTVRPHTDGAKLRPELDMLDIQDHPRGAEHAAKESLGAANHDPWDSDSVEGTLKALVHSINVDGHYDPSIESEDIRASENPIVEFAPALILRERSAKGLTDTLEQIREQIERGDDIPGEFQDLAEIRRPDDRELHDEQDDQAHSFAGEIFFPLRSNDEQLHIVDVIRSANGVLVQGPPGTGKSHTIANLICHLLATGQRMLITAQTPRALQVLQNLVPAELRPLCIALLGSGPDERRSLEASVRGFLTQYDSWNEDAAKVKRNELQDRLGQHREEKARLTRQLRDIRESETHPRIVAQGGYRGTAARIAEAVNRDRANYDWFTDSVSLEQQCPFSVRDLQIVHSWLPKLVPERDRQLDLALPEQLPAAEQLAQLFHELHDASEEEQNAAPGADAHLVDLLSGIERTRIESVRDACSHFRDTQRQLAAMPHQWIGDALRDILAGSPFLWQELLRSTKAVISSIEGLVALADDIHIEFPDSADLKALRSDACALKEHMEGGGTLGWGLFRAPAVKEREFFIKNVRLRGRTCSTAADFGTVADCLRVQIECEKAWTRWEGRRARENGAYALQLTAFKSLENALTRALALDQLVSRCRDAVTQLEVISEPVWCDETEVNRLLSTCRFVLARQRRQDARENINSAASVVARAAGRANAHPITHELLCAIRNADIDAVRQHLEKVNELMEQRQRIAKIEAYLARLDRELPDFTSSLKQTFKEPQWKERIEGFEDAWKWAQARYWIEDYIQQGDVPALTLRIKQIEDDIGKIIAKLASLHAWSLCFSRLRGEHLRHMQAWQQSIDQLHKGTGKHAPRYRREAQEHLSKCREAVPAWIMPLHRVWETVSPAANLFDVVVVDEASQCGFDAFPLFYLGKTIVIVGDDKQISPSIGRFVDLDAVVALREEFLSDFEHKESFGVERSLFDQGRLRYGTRRIVLREHFRCMPEIIRFSNDLCYADTPLIPLRQYGPDRLTPLERIFVEGGYREGKGELTSNPKEAEAISERIVEMCGDERYNGKTMGVVVLQGKAQAPRIERLLLDRLGAEEIERRRLVCGESYSFQGDERDVIFLSLVAATSHRIGTLTGRTFEQGFNVAASRARDSMVLCHSVTLDDLSVRCLRRRLLEFFEITKPIEIAGIPREDLERAAAQDNRLVVRPRDPFGSWFEVDVALQLLRKGLTVLAQHEVAGKRIDLVVEGGKARLAVECDGDHWHGADRYDADMERQRILERCGWEFVRVRESEFYANRERALAVVWRALEERDILPGWQPPDLGGATPEVGVSPAVDQGATGDESVTDEGPAKPSESVQEPSAPGSGRKGIRSPVPQNPPSLVLNPPIGPSDRPTPGAKEPKVKPASDATPGENPISAKQIKEAVVAVLSRQPHRTCKRDALTSLVLKELGIRTRGQPYKEFNKRTMQAVRYLEQKEIIESYKSKNERLRLL